MSKVNYFMTEICVEDVHTWQSTPFLSIDIDWAHDAILQYTIDILSRYAIPVTWFATHDTEILKQISDNTNFEIGIHPNFNNLLNQADNSLCPRKVMDQMCSFVPNAKITRSHSLTQNSYLLDLFASYNINYESNLFIPSYSKISLKPWRHWNGLTRLPYLWEDDVSCVLDSQQTLGIKDTLKLPGLKIFDFHPIHIYLNTETLERYEQTRFCHNNPTALRDYRFSGYGTCDRLYDLLENWSER